MFSETVNSTYIEVSTIIYYKTWWNWTLGLKIMGKSAIADLDLVRQFHQFGHFDQFYSLIVMSVIIIIIELLSPLLLSFHNFFYQNI